MDDTTTKSPDSCKRKRQNSVNIQNTVAPHGRERTSRVDQVTNQGLPASMLTTASLLQSLSQQNSLYGGALPVAQQQTTPIGPMMVNQDQIQNLLILLNPGTSSDRASTSNQPTASLQMSTSKSSSDQSKSYAESITQSDGTRAPPLNYEIATLLASLQNPGRRTPGTPNDSSSSSQQQQQQGLLQPQQQQYTQTNSLPQPHTDTPSQQEILQAYFQSMNNPYQNTNVHHIEQHSPIGAGPFRNMMPQTHTHTQASTSNQYLQPAGQRDYSQPQRNPFLYTSISPTNVQQSNDLNQDLLRLLLMSLSSPNLNMGMSLPQLPTSMSSHQDTSGGSAINNLILQALGVTPSPPPVAPPPPQQLDPNLLNMLLGQIAMNPSMFSTNAASPAASNPSHLKNEEEGAEKQAADDSSADTCELANIGPIPMATDMDEDHVSKYQCLVRKQIHFFEANDGDVGSTAQGRNKPIVLGQVGIQCRHCVKSPPKLRARGSVYFPSKWSGIYQAAQNMATAHFAFCYDTPESIKAQLKKLKDGKSTAGGGKKFWGESAAELGVIEDRNGLRFKKP